MTIRIATYIVSGVVIGVALGAVCISVLPWWLGISIAAVSVICALMSR